MYESNTIHNCSAEELVYSILDSGQKIDTVFTEYCLENGKYPPSMYHMYIELLPKIQIIANQLILIGDYIDNHPNLDARKFKHNHKIKWVIDSYNDIHRYIYIYSTKEIDKSINSIICSYDNNCSESVHKCPLPKNLISILINHYIPIHYFVCDLYSGSGAIAKSCYNLGIDYIACEIEKSQVDQSLKYFL